MSLGSVNVPIQGYIVYKFLSLDSSTTYVSFARLVLSIREVSVEVKGRELILAWS